MAFSDPQSVTVSGTAITLPGTGIVGPNGHVYTSNDGLTQLTISSAYGTRNRRTARLTTTVTVADPLVSGTNVVRSSSVYFVIDAPKNGITNAQLLAQATGLFAWATASSGANITKILGGES
jgi:hypothetical protein